jgi:putative transposase
MSRWHNQYIDGCVHFCTATVSGWRPLLHGEAIAVLYGAWDSARRELAVRVLAYVVMPEHFHLLLWAERGAAVRAFLQRTLSATSRRLQPGGGFWKERPRVLPVWSNKVLKTKLDYVHQNPVAAADQWLHSSFREIEMGRLDVPFRCDSWEGMFT